jgi:hypothetical protein
MARCVQVAGELHAYTQLGDDFHAIVQEYGDVQVREVWLCGRCARLHTARLGHLVLRRSTQECTTPCATRVACVGVSVEKRVW